MIPKLRNFHASAWFIPLLYAAGALVLGFTVPRLAYSILPGYLSAVSVGAAIGIYSAIASGMIALTGIVFSITFLMVQFSATAYSPRLVLWIARDPVLSHSMGVFTATFLYAIAALAWVDRGGSGRVPLSGTLLVTVLLVVSVIMFIFLIQRVGMLQVNRMLVFTADQGRKTIESLYPSLSTPAYQSSPQMIDTQCLQTLVHYGRPSIIQEIDIQALVEIAIRNECAIELVPSIGDAAYDTDLLPYFRTKLSMIFAKERGSRYVEEQAHGSTDDRGAKASRGRTEGGRCCARGGRVQAHALRLEGEVRWDGREPGAGSEATA